MFFEIAFVFVALLIPKTQGQCRILKFTTDPIHGYQLTNHTIRTTDVSNEEVCELQCYQEPNCVSYNFKKTEEDNGKHKCDLNNATFEHADDLKKSQYFLYRGAENACVEKPCKNNATCQAGYTDKDYQCLCIPGFTGDNCEKDINECTTKTHSCDDNAVCNNTKGSYNCTCKDGFVGDGKECTDVDECSNGTADCDITGNAVCNNTKGSYNCTCKDGFEGNGKECTALALSVICEGQTKTISCQNGKVIDVKDANYGRLDKQTCIHSAMSNTNCRSSISLQVVGDECNGQVTCQLVASSAKFGGDPCGGTYKYLQVKYRCLEL